MLEGNQPTVEIALTHFIVSDDVERSRRFYAEVLIDAAGHIRYAHVGEGAYGRTERAIRALLNEGVHGSRPAEAARG